MRRFDASEGCDREAWAVRTGLGFDVASDQSLVALDFVQLTRALLVSLVAMAVIIPESASADDDNGEDESVNGGGMPDCKILSMVEVDEEESPWTLVRGECREGLAHGYGEAVNGFDDIYVGEFQDGKIHGNGVMTMLDGSRWMGEFRDGLLYGYGMVNGFYKDRHSELIGRFEGGSWSDGMFIVKYGDEVFQGEKTGDKIWGVFAVEGGVYAGDIQSSTAGKGSKAGGNGIVRNSDGSLYIGEFLDGHPNGNGTLFMGHPEPTKVKIRKTKVKVPRSVSENQNTAEIPTLGPDTDVPDNRDLFQMDVRFPFPDELTYIKRTKGRRGEKKKGGRGLVTMERLQVAGVDVKAVVGRNMGEKRYSEVVTFDEVEVPLEFPAVFEGESVYDGEFQDGLLHGSGALFYGDGDMLTGRWIQGEISPDCIKGGEWTLVVGDCSSGLVKDGHGEALEEGTGTVYEGEFTDGQFYPGKPAVRVLTSGN